jgi:hypothetical protein
MRNIHIPLSATERIKQEVSQEIDLKNTINQQNLSDIFKNLHPVIAKYVFFSKPTDLSPCHR